MKSSFVLILSSVVVGSAFLGCKHKDETPTTPPPVKVAVTTVGNYDSSGSRQYSGTVASSNTSTVSFAVAGTIETLTLDEGRPVTKGQLLGSLKDGDYVNADNIARAQLAEANDALARLKKLHDANALPDIKWVEVQQKVAQAQNAAEIAARTLGQTKLYAPMSGVILRKFADAGQNVAPIQPVYEIISTDMLTIDISVSENEIADFYEGQPATVSFDFNDMAPVKGVISQKAVVADPLTRAYKIKIAIPSENGKILPGMVGNVVFSADVQSDASSQNSSFMLPSQAVNITNDNRSFVWVVDSGKAQRRFVTADRLVADGVLVTDGLCPGDSVIIEGMQKVGSGTPVEVVLK